MIFISKYLIPKGFIGITLYPFIFLKAKKWRNNPVLINHEKIHLKQQLELFVVFFYVFYVLEWSFKLIKNKDKKEAYKNISFEREAYYNECDLNYLSKRRTWAFVSYL